ncbi:formate dehydrogenase accessory protein FdhE [Methylosinus sp. RM1]|uniref:formate dehydrogenase accessory protein FdhE n=1 Tax=Methylosinus sp. RM1 TaxID=2583817 RepID=UPI00140A52C9|nr:formate dehydrogenase accessory protein FdhE [Methylosinus sp. RM1]
MSVIEKSVVAAPAQDDGLLRAASSPLLGGALALVAFAQQLIGHIDCDVSWFLTFAEKVLDGRAAYVEVSDPNPPGAFLSLMPAVLLARALHLRAEAVVVALVFFAAAASIGLSFHLLRLSAARSLREWMPLGNAAIFLLLVAPEIVFAEREHIALLALLPLLATLAAEEGARPSPRFARIAAGVCGGVAVTLKPHFALAVILPALAIAWRARSLRALWRVELVSAALASIALTGATLLAFPAYLSQALPLAFEVYGPARDDLGHFLSHSLALAYLALLAGFLVAARGALGRAPLVALAASLGFFVAFLLQGKGWMNHAYPAMILLLFAWIFFALREAAPATGAKSALMKFLFLPALLAAPAYFGIVEQLTDREEHEGLLAAVAEVAPPHPRIATIASQLDFGHPLTRRLDGEWVGRQNALWTTALVGRLLETASPPRREALEARRIADLAALAQDIRAGRPDIVVAEDRATREWVLKRPETAAALDGYRLAKRAGDVEIWRRAE